uniref:Zgc:92380 n=1 Tax=Latimeria chalumnae TaxID=7897 RepID=H3AH19_LATCH
MSKFSPSSTTYSNRSMSGKISGQRPAIPSFTASSLQGGQSIRVSLPRLMSTVRTMSTSIGDLSSRLANSNVINNEKETMQGLNDRLAGYLGRVRGLEAANRKLEEQIKELIAKKAPLEKDWSIYEIPLADLRKQVSDMILDNARLTLQIDNARLAADDFKVKHDAELAMRQGVEQDIHGLRKILDDTNLSRMQLESQIESLKEELIFLRKNHREEVDGLRAQIANSNVTVEVDAPKHQNLGETISKIRSEYEKESQKNLQDTEAWYKNKIDILKQDVAMNTQDLERSQKEATELRRQIQALEIEIQTLINENNNLEDNLRDTKQRYNAQQSDLNAALLRLEDELRQCRANMERQSVEYRNLLNVKVKLEEEIQTYRRLLEGELDRNIGSSQHSKPNRQTIKKVVVTTQEIVDGKVVSEQSKETVERE